MFDHLDVANTGRSPTAQPAPQPECDVCLLLRAHAEQSWLNREVLPVIAHLQAADDLEPSQRTAARAYLEATWMEAQVRAMTTDSTYGAVRRTDADSLLLNEQARSYYSAVRSLRDLLASAVASTLELPDTATL